MQTEELIANLAAQSSATRPACPYRMLTRWLALTLGCAVVFIALMGLRPDLGLRLDEPLFVLELLALLCLFATTAISACWLAFPDQRQQPWAVLLPLPCLILYAAFLLYRLLVPEATAAPLEADNGFHCSLCIAGIALIPGFALLYLLRQCASVAPRRAGAVAMLASATTGHIILKFAEANDQVPHLLVSHLLPILLLGAAGFWLGRKFLAW